jgi:hypothetical protein
MLYTKTIHGIWLTCLEGSLLLGVSESTKSRLVLMVLLTDTKLDLWLEVLLKSMVWIMRRPLLLLLAYLLCVLHWPLLPLDIDHFLKWMSKMSSLKAISVRKSICSHLLASLLLRTRFVVSVELSMALSKLLGMVC